MNPMPGVEDRARVSRGTSHEAIHRRVAAVIRRRRSGGGTLLDVGCGVGSLWPFVAEDFDHYLGADVVRYDGFPEAGTFCPVDLDAGRVDLPDAAADVVAAIGSDHPTVPLARVHEAFERIEAGADVAIGPAEDGGYYLIAICARALAPRLFADIAWSTAEVLPTTLERCRELGLAVELLDLGSDVDTPEDLARLGRELAASPELAATCPRTRDLLASWGRLGNTGGGA